ncbi:MAG: hypothetical protein H7X89_08670 [Rhizobiales bacterium]|nr:hypothetical protein [Hyphomicrobiales bacterium]
MQGVARLFFTVAVIYAICGMFLGLHMGISGNHLQMPTHAHILLAGWVSSALFAFFYQQFPLINVSRIATVHFWFQTISALVMMVSLLIFYGGDSGNASAEPGVAIGSMGYLAGMVLFAWISLRAMWKA